MILLNKLVLRFLLSLGFLLVHIIHLNAQTVNETELDSIYALQAEYYNAEEYSKILELSEYARKFELQNAQDSITFARITAYIGYANNKFSKYFNSIAGFEEALRYIPNSNKKDIIRTKYGISYDLLTRYYSLRRFKKALNIADEIEKLFNQYDFFSFNNHFALYQRKSRILNSLGYYGKAKIEIEKIKQKLELIDPADDKTKLYGWMRYYRTSLLTNYYEAIYIRENDRNHLAEIARITPNIELNIKKLDSIYKNTKSLQNPLSRRDIWNLSYYIGALYYTSNFYKEIENYEKSLQYIEKAIPLLKTANEPQRNVTEYLRLRANLIGLLGNTQKASMLLDDIEKNFEKNSFNLDELYVFKGDIYARNKELDSTLYYYRKAFQVIHSSENELKEDFSNFSTRYQFPTDSKQIDHMSLMLMTYFTENQKAQETAKVFNDIAYYEFLEGHENLNLSLGNKQLFYHILETRIYLNKDTLNNKEEFISNIENISNRFAWQKFIQSRNTVQLPIIDSLENVEYEIRKQIVLAKKQRKQKQKDSLNTILEKHHKELAKNYPILTSYTQNSFDTASFQNSLEDTQVALKYLFFLDQFVVIQISKDTISWDLRPWKKEEKKLVSNHIDFVKNPNHKLDLTSDLTQLLIPKNALEFESLIIIPDNTIYNLPFEALWYNDDYLIKEKAIHYSSHLRFAYTDKVAEEPENTKATIFAPNYPKSNTQLVTRNGPVFLEGAQKEARALENLFPSKSFIGNKATKENFVNYKSEGNILHLAMHASVDEDDSEFSHFNFSRGEKLYLEELYGLKIPSELAVLSACNTGIGKEEDASGMASLQRAFNFAGTKATLASLWEVPDETTSKIMISFYENLKNGETKSVALQKAKLEYINTTNNDKLSHPYYWAGFVLYGTDDPIYSPSNTLYIAIGIILFLIILIFLFVKMKADKKKDMNVE
jgi:CHAT domain-containing protein